MDNQNYKDYLTKTPNEEEKEISFSLSENNIIEIDNETMEEVKNEVGMDKEKSTELNKKKDEQERTKIKKKIFLEYWLKTKGIIQVCCDKTEIDRGTYYLWEKNDPVFKRRLDEVLAERNKNVEDELMAQIHLKKHAPSIHFYLERKHPDYKSKSSVEITPGEGVGKTLKQLIDEDEEQLNQIGFEYPR